jgi:hypothetical protein
MSDDDADDRHLLSLPIYRRNGTRIRVANEWERLLLDDDYRRVAEDRVGARRVATVWLGLDHNFGLGALGIFETMVVGPDDHAHYCRRYATEREANEGHATLVAWLRAGGDLAAYDDADE